MKSMASSFFMLGRIKTTEAKAKELRPFVERFVTRAKSPTLASQRVLYKYFRGEVIQKLLQRGKDYEKTSGGYTRIIKTGLRKSDGAKMAIIEFVKLKV